MMKKIVLPFLSVFIIYASCNKEDAPPPAPPADITPTVQNLAGSYKLVKYCNILPNGSEQDITDTGVPSCERDDIYMLKASLVYEVNEGANVCPGEDFSARGH